MTEAHLVPEDQAQEVKYSAHYDSFPLINDAALKEQVDKEDKRTNREAFEMLFETIIAHDLPRLLKMRASQTEITVDDVKTWLSTSHMRYREVPSEISSAAVADLREKLAQTPSDKKRDHLTTLIDTLEMPWGYDEFGKQQKLRNIWEQQLNSALKSQACAEDVLNKVQHFGGFFALGSSIQQISGFIEILSDHFDIGQHGRELSGDSAFEFRKRVEQCNTYAERFELLKTYRAKLLTFLQEYIGKHQAGNKVPDLP